MDRQYWPQRHHNPWEACIDPSSAQSAASRVQPVLSIVVPAYNEMLGLDALYLRLSAVLDRIGEPWEIVLVNDGSRDATLAVMRALRMHDGRVAIVNLARNFGKEIATTAGLDHATGDAVVVIDADLQDPPELIADMVTIWRGGIDMVYAQRRHREGETWLKRATAKAFYRLMGRINRVEMPRDTGDFRLMSRRVVGAVRSMREQHRFMKGLFAWVGFPSQALVYDRAPRHAGSTKWNYWSLWNLAIEGVTGFTTLPLKLATYLGLAIGFLTVPYIAQMVVRTLVWGNPVAGYPSLLAVVLFLGGAQLITLGIIGEYLGRIFDETKGRPLYIIERHEPSQQHGESRGDDRTRCLPKATSDSPATRTPQ